MQTLMEGFQENVVDESVEAVEAMPDGCGLGDDDDAPAEQTDEEAREQADEARFARIYMAVLRDGNLEKSTAEPADLLWAFKRLLARGQTLSRELRNSEEDRKALRANIVHEREVAKALIVERDNLAIDLAKMMREASA